MDEVYINNNNQYQILLQEYILDQYEDYIIELM
jgi:hypothetical protein